MRATIRSGARSDWSLDETLEDLALLGSAVTGSGNELDNRITGNDNGNDLSGNGGNDMLIGGKGADTLSGADGNEISTAASAPNALRGGEGDDLYLIHDERRHGSPMNYPIRAMTPSRARSRFSFRRQCLPRGPGADWKRGTSTDPVTRARTRSLETAAITVSWGSVATTCSSGGTGGRVRRDGGTGSDTMRGGAGDDFDVVDDAGDQVIEAANGGTNDVVFAFANWTLAANVENMTIYGRHALLREQGRQLHLERDAGGTAIVIDGGAGDDVHHEDLPANEAR